MPQYTYTKIYKNIHELLKFKPVQPPLKSHVYLLCMCQIHVCGIR